MIENTTKSLQEQYKEMTDENIILDIHGGDKNALEYLMYKYEELVRMKASRFFMYGSEKCDILQEARIGLYNASRNYDSSKYNSFKSFANLCIDRQLITAVKKANRQKNIPLNSAISINYIVGAEDENEGTELQNLLDNKIEEDPSEMIANREYYKYMHEKITDSLSKHEKDVLQYYTNGKSYEEIANILNCKVKSVDTALTRIRRKANKIKNNIAEA